MRHLSPSIGPGPSDGPGRDSSGVSRAGSCRWVCGWAPIISARLGGIHTPISNTLLANSITSRPTTCSRTIVLHYTHQRPSRGSTQARQGAGSPHFPSLRKRPAVGWLAGCMEASCGPHRALRLNKSLPTGVPPCQPAHPTPSFPSNACDRNARCCVTRLAHHMKVGSPDSAPLRLGSSISNPPALISSVASRRILCCADGTHLLCRHLSAGRPSG